MAGRLHKLSDGLNWEVREMLHTAKQHRNKEARFTDRARRYLKNGDITKAGVAAREAVMHRDQAIQYETQADRLHQMSTGTSNMASNVEQLRTMVHVANASRAALSGFDVSDVAEVTKELETVTEDMDVATRLLEGVIGECSGSRGGQRSVSDKTATLLEELTAPAGSSQSDHSTASADIQLLRALIMEEGLGQSIGASSGQPGKSASKSSSRPEVDSMRRQIAEMRQ